MPVALNVELFLRMGNQLRWFDHVNGKYQEGWTAGPAGCSHRKTLQSTAKHQMTLLLMMLLGRALTWSQQNRQRS